MQEDVFAVVLDPVDLIYVARVVFALPALHNILSPVPAAVDRVIAFVTEEHVRTGIAVYAVVTFSANHRVVTSSCVEHVSLSQTGEVVFASTGVDYVRFICAHEVVGPGSTIYSVGQGHPAS